MTHQKELLEALKDAVDSCVMESYVNDDVSEFQIILHKGRVVRAHMSDDTIVTEYEFIVAIQEKRDGTVADAKRITAAEQKENDEEADVTSLSEAINEIIRKGYDNVKH